MIVITMILYYFYYQYHYDIAQCYMAITATNTGRGLRVAVVRHTQHLTLYTSQV